MDETYIFGLISASISVRHKLSLPYNQHSGTEVVQYSYFSSLVLITA